MFRELRCTTFVDLDGTCFLEQGDLQAIITKEAVVLPGVHLRFAEWREKDYYVVITTARPESMRALTLKHLNDNGLWCDQLVMGLPIGPRVVINDAKPNGMITAKAFCIERDKGLKSVNI